MKRSMRTSDRQPAVCELRAREMPIRSFSCDESQPPPREKRRKVSEGKNRLEEGGVGSRSESQAWSKEAIERLERHIPVSAAAYFTPDLPVRYIFLVLYPSLIPCCWPFSHRPSISLLERISCIIRARSFSSFCQTSIVLYAR